MPKATVNGAEFEYEAEGSGEPVLLISPGPIADSFLPLFREPALRGRYRLIRYHQRKADIANGEEPMSFAQHAADAAALIDQLTDGCAHVAGHSTGAAIALQMAVDRPDAVHTLALLEPPLVSTVASAGAFFEKVGPALAAYESGDRAGAMAAFLSGACSLEWEACQKAIERTVPGGVAQAIRDADNFFGSYLPALSAWEFGAEDAAMIRQPVLSVAGTKSEQLFVDSNEVLRSWLTQLETCTVLDVAHLLHIERPEPVARGLAAFFDAHPMLEKRAATHDVAQSRT
jgi:pimeloyl-ACP methyl ester carboxylesterase